MKSPKNKHGNDPVKPYEKIILISEIINLRRLRRKLRKTLKLSREIALQIDNHTE